MFSPVSQTVKESACNAGDQDSILRLGTSPREGNGHPLAECLTQSWGSASEAAFLISSQVMLILIQGSFLENHWFRL